MNELPWFMYYTGTANDPKLEHTANVLGYHPMFVLGVWSTLLDRASASPIRGKLLLTPILPYTLDDLALACKTDLNTITNIVGMFTKLDMMDLINNTYSLLNWDKRQETREDRANRLHRERQKRYEEKQKTVIPDAINDAPMTQDSISISISNSLIKESLNEKTIFSIRDAEKAICHVTGWVTIPGGWFETCEKILDLLQHYGWDDTLTRLTTSRDDWVSHKRKDNGANYKLTNPAWVNNAIAGETIGVKQLTKEERIKAEMAEIVRRTNP